MSSCFNDVIEEMVKLFFYSFIYYVPLKYYDISYEIMYGCRITHEDHGHIKELGLKEGMSLSSYEALERLLKGPHGRSLEKFYSAI